MSVCDTSTSTYVAPTGISTSHSALPDAIQSITHANVAFGQTNVLFTADALNRKALEPTMLLAPTSGISEPAGMSRARDAAFADSAIASTRNTPGDCRSANPTNLSVAVAAASSGSDPSE